MKDRLLFALICFGVAAILVVGADFVRSLTKNSQGESKTPQETVPLLVGDEQVAATNGFEANSGIRDMVGPLVAGVMFWSGIAAYCYGVCLQLVNAEVFVRPLLRQDLLERRSPVFCGSWIAGSVLLLVLVGFILRPLIHHESWKQVAGILCCATAASIVFTAALAISMRGKT